MMLRAPLGNGRCVPRSHASLLLRPVYLGRLDPNACFLYVLVLV